MKDVEHLLVSRTVELRPRGERFRMNLLTAIDGEFLDLGRRRLGNDLLLDLGGRDFLAAFIACHIVYSCVCFLTLFRRRASTSTGVLRHAIPSVLPDAEVNTLNYTIFSEKNQTPPMRG